MFLLEPKSNQKPSAHLRWLFAQPLAHEKNALLSGISSFKILLFDGEFFESIPRPMSSAFFPFFRQGNEPEAKGLPSEERVFLNTITILNSYKKRTLEGFNYFSNPIAHVIGILSIFPPRK